MFEFLTNKIKITPEKYNYKSGEIVRGTIELKMKKPLEATELLAGIKVQEKYNSYRNGRNSTEIRTIYKNSIPIDGEKTYTNAAVYNFELQLPDLTVDTSNIPEGINQAINTIAKTANFLTRSRVTRYWYITSQLKIKGIDMRKKIKLNVI